MHPATADLELGTVLSALSDGHRRRVIVELARLPVDAERTCQSFGMPLAKQTVTHHFKILRNAGLIKEVDYGNRKAISLRKHDIDQRFPGLLDVLVAGADTD
ncbi:MULTISPECIES: ArsR/SmtB family transcription factor [Rhodococcus]|uniref:DNA-binding transcriptional regulator, ArsR family n=2 Tax=Rhodococcus TaxID=1827 RepID=A0A1H4JDH1_RHOJO|nr:MULTISPECIES: helix-turn-helix domain-containing protein [Rhodococcus]WAM19131.1 helix-turn-helix domain-containing protein [Rhodococcus sp. JS3073]SEB44360.1 DNA-binding transcriptional regulator, ArsR family [Rhodococcus jostii]